MIITKLKGVVEMKSAILTSFINLTEEDLQDMICSYSGLSDEVKLNFQNMKVHKFRIIKSETGEKMVKVEFRSEFYKDYK